MMDRMYKKLAFGLEQGVGINVIAYSNKNSRHFSGEKAFFVIEGLSEKKICTGYKWQCVEYARRWLIVNYKVFFESIDMAYEIFDLKNVFNLVTQKEQIFYSYPNDNSEPPKIGDLIIFPAIWDYTGHVAVCVNSDPEKGYIDIAEQNYDFDWETKEYSRRIALLKKGTNYILIDKHPAFLSKDTDYSPLRKKILGWKRV